ncbi:hypothetical protein U0O11_11350 [Cobetia sp. D5]|uniref:hypothetical protein n=1 Tax=Cobetia sp. D5 TaxID=3105867 RepID=UPI002D78DEB8|nr:hypothetical protein [Cobetia sp. D5]
MTDEYEKYSISFKTDIAFMAIKGKKTIEKKSKTHTISCEFIIRPEKELHNNACIEDEEKIVKYNQEDKKKLNKKLRQFINRTDHLALEIELLKRKYFK